LRTVAISFLLNLIRISAAMDAGWWLGCPAKAPRQLAETTANARRLSPELGLG